MTENDIIYQAGIFWVCRSTNKNKSSFLLMQDKNCFAESIGSFSLTVDGLSNAIYCCSYRSKRPVTISSKEAVELAQKIFQ